MRKGKLQGMLVGGKSLKVAVCTLLHTTVHMTICLICLMVVCFHVCKITGLSICTPKDRCIIYLIWKGVYCKRNFSLVVDNSSFRRKIDAKRKVSRRPTVTHLLRHFLIDYMTYLLSTA